MWPGDEIWTSAGFSQATAQLLNKGYVQLCSRHTHNIDYFYNISHFRKKKRVSNDASEHWDDIMK